MKRYILKIKKIIMLGALGTIMSFAIVSSTQAANYSYNWSVKKLESRAGTEAVTTLNKAYDSRGIAIYGSAKAKCNDKSAKKSGYGNVVAYSGIAMYGKYTTYHYVGPGDTIDSSTEKKI